MPGSCVQPLSRLLFAIILDCENCAVSANSVYRLHGRQNRPAAGTQFTAVRPRRPLHALGRLLRRVRRADICFFSPRGRGPTVKRRCTISLVGCRQFVPGPLALYYLYTPKLFHIAKGDECVLVLSRSSAADCTLIPKSAANHVRPTVFL